jgi:hypothetical protein
VGFVMAIAIYLLNEGPTSGQRSLAQAIIRATRPRICLSSRSEAALGKR